MNNDDNQILAIKALNEYATEENSHFTRPESFDGLLVCRHSISIKIPELDECWHVYRLATQYLNSYMQVAAYNGRLSGTRSHPPVPNEWEFREVITHWCLDSDCNALPDYCTIKMQVFLKPAQKPKETT